MGTKRPSFVVIRSYKEGEKMPFFDPCVYLGHVPKFTSDVGYSKSHS